MNTPFVSDIRPSEVPENRPLPGLTVIEQEFCVATADQATDPNQAMRALLADVRGMLKMDIAFVSQFVDGRRVFRHVAGGGDLLNVGASDPLEETYCQRIVDGRMPTVIEDTTLNAEAQQLEVTKTLGIGAYLSAPVILQSGQVYGTLCCISSKPRTDIGMLEQHALRTVANLISEQIEREPI